MSTQAVTESLWTSMPQQRENSICINAPFAAGLDAEKESDNPSRALPGPGLQPATDCMPGHAEGDTALCQQKRPARFTNGLETPNQCRLEMPRGISRMPSRGSFHTSLWPKRSGGRGRITSKGSDFCLFKTMMTGASLP